MVGEGVLHECLLHPGVERVFIVNRRPSGVKKIMDFHDGSIWAESEYGKGSAFKFYIPKKPKNESPNK